MGATSMPLGPTIFLLKIPFSRVATVSKVSHLLRDSPHSAKLSFVDEIVVLFVANLTAKRVVETGIDGFHVKTIAFVVHIKLSGTHSTTNLMLVVVRHDRRSRDSARLSLIYIRAIG